MTDKLLNEIEAAHDPQSIAPLCDTIRRLRDEKAAAQQRIAELEAALRNMIEYASDDIEEYSRVYAGYRDERITQMQGELAQARKALAGGAS